MILDTLPTALISNTGTQNWDGTNESLNTNDDTFSLTDLYEVTFKQLLPNMFNIDWCYFKLNGFGAGYKISDNAGLGGTNQEQGNNKLRQWWSYLKNSDLNRKTKQFQWNMSHDGLYTGILVHEIDPQIVETCKFCKIEEESLSHIFLKCNIVAKV